MTPARSCLKCWTCLERESINQLLQAHYVNKQKSTIGKNEGCQRGNKYNLKDNLSFRLSPVKCLPEDKQSATVVIKYIITEEFLKHVNVVNG